MAVVLQIIGGLVVLVFLLIAGGLLVLRWKVRKIAKELENISGMGGMVGEPPTRMRLRRANAGAWEDIEVREHVQAFDRLGYQRVSAFESADMPGLILLPFASSDQKSYAVVYHHAGGVGVWCDLYTKYADGTSLTVTSAPRGGELEHRPGSEKAYLPGSSVEQLVEVHTSKLQDGPTRYASIEGFVQDFEKAFEEEMAWRFSKGYSDEEIRAVAALDGGYSEEVMEQTRYSMNARAAEQLTEVLRRQYLASSGITAAEWEDQRERLVIVHDKLESQDVLEEVACYLDIPDDLYEEAGESEKPPREFMDWLNEMQEPRLQFRKLRTLHDPVEADVWLAPEESN